MVEYKKIQWFDKIKDQNGNTIQEGTPLSSKNFNRMENGIANAIIELNNNSEAIRESIPSGITRLSVIDYAYMRTNPNKFRMGGGTAFVNGWKIEFPNDNWIIDLPMSPIEGEQDDFIFLEVWKEQSSDTSGEKVSWRIRVVQDLDFDAYTNDGFYTNTYVGWQYVNRKITAQGGNVSPIPQNSNNNMGSCGSFVPAVVQRAYSCNNPIVETDTGLFITGNGTQASKDLLKTADGYVYAIPLFRIKRRNSGVYSAINPNGSNILVYSLFNVENIKEGELRQITVSTSLYNEAQVGDYFNNLSNTTTDKYIKLISKDGNNQITIQALRSGLGSDNFKILSRRYDGLFSNIVYDRDIIDLRHLVSFTGFDYDSLVREAIDNLSKGQLYTKENKKMVKTYHGLPKTPIDANHVFYASFDGTTVAELGGSLSINNPMFFPAPTGSGLQSKDVLSIPLAELSIATLDCFMETKVLQDKAGMGDGSTIIGFTLTNSDSWKNSGVYIGKSASSKPNSYYVLNGETGFSFSAENVLVNEFTHIRLVANLITKRIIIYINGVKVLDIPCTFKDTQKINALRMGNNKPYMYADVSISNIDRGAIFATLPVDFVAGYARISKAFNGQRKTYSDALLPQYTLGIAKGVGSNHSRGLAVTQAIVGKWTTGDNIRVKGLAGEVISGVVDSDTALTRITGSNSNTNQFILDDVSKLSVNDTVYVYNNKGEISINGTTITTIDTANKTITVNATVTQGMAIGGFIVEYTPSSSVPVIKFMNGGTLVPVTGTWSGLGTNEAIFTLGANASLINADLQIEYSLNMPAGQGGTGEVYTSTLGGEYKGKKLVTGTLAIRDDLKGKTVGDNNPITVKYLKSNVIQLPATFIQEVNNVDYANLTTQGDGNAWTLSTSVNGEMPQILVSIDLIKEVEAKYGTIPAIDKLGWVRNNIYKIAVACNVKGSSPLGSGVKVVGAYPKENRYFMDYKVNALDSLMNITYAGFFDMWINGAIDNNGLLHVIAYAEASNGITASKVTLDSVNVEIDLRGITGYDMLVPENPRRDDGLNNVLLVRKETKEIQTYFNTVNTDGVITYGDYVPLQVVTANKSFKAVTDIKGAMLSIGTGKGFREVPAYGGTYGGSIQMNAVYNLFDQFEYNLPALCFDRIFDDMVYGSDAILYNRNYRLFDITTVSAAYSTTYGYVCYGDDLQNIQGDRHYWFRLLPSVAVIPTAKYCSIVYTLALYQNELYLAYKPAEEYTDSAIPKTCFRLVKLNGRPLVK